MKLKFEYETSYIEFDLIFRKRKTLEIKIEPPDNIKVVAPLGISKDKIIEIVRDKADWINEKLNYYKSIDYKTTKREFANGESFMFLGKYYLLKINTASGIKKIDVRLDMDNKQFIITAPDYSLDNSYTSDDSKELMRKAMEVWYRKSGQEIIGQRIRHYQKYFDIVPRSFRVKQQKRRWGSCTYKNDLLFNWRCIMADEAALDYIVVHEMCHMKHKDHSRNFWNLVQYILPDYENRKKWLKDNGFKMDF